MPAPLPYGRFEARKIEHSETRFGVGGEFDRTDPQRPIELDGDVDPSRWECSRCAVCPSRREGSLGRYLIADRLDPEPRGCALPISAHAVDGGVTRHGFAEARGCRRVAKESDVEPSTGLDQTGRRPTEVFSTPTENRKERDPMGDAALEGTDPARVFETLGDLLEGSGQGLGRLLPERSEFDSTLGSLGGGRQTTLVTAFQGP